MCLDAAGQGSATGVSATGSSGAVTIKFGASVTATGVSGSSGVGSVTTKVDANISATGVAGTGSVGDITARIPTDVSVTGVSATGSVGSVTVAFGYAVAGVSATGRDPLSVSIGIGKYVYPEGISATMELGTAFVWNNIVPIHNASWADISISNSSSCLLYTSPSPRDRTRSRMPSSA